jgi:hypothetical protein
MLLSWGKGEKEMSKEEELIREFDKIHLTNKELRLLLFAFFACGFIVGWLLRSWRKMSQKAYTKYYDSETDKHCWGCVHWRYWDKDNYCMLKKLVNENDNNN